MFSNLEHICLFLSLVYFLIFIICQIPLDMELIIKDEQIDLNRIRFKTGKHSIKLLYYLDPVIIIGICIKIRKPLIRTNDEVSEILVQDKEQQTLLRKLDTLFSSKVSNYQSFFRDNVIHIRSSQHIPSKGDIYININNIKNMNGKNYVNIFSL